MKIKPTGRLALFFALLAGSCIHVFGLPMIPVGVPIISVEATSPLASEPGNTPAIFTVYRAGGTNNAVTVDLRIGGTASNGVDYAVISNAVTLSAGQTSAQVVITPVNEPSATGFKTVVLSVARPFLMRHAEPEFFVGSWDRALAYIAYNYSNIPPSVTLVGPTNGSSYFSRPNILLSANAYDSNGVVSTVQFQANGIVVGTVSNSNPTVVLRESRGSVAARWSNSRYQVVWTNVAPGDYSLTAVAADNAGLQTTSSPVNITVTTNLPSPTVRIVSPQEKASFPDLAPVSIYAAASETNGVVDTVAFLANGVTLAVETNYLAAHPTPHPELRVQWVPYYFLWTNAAIGTNVLTAVAMDNNGVQSTSAPVNIVVTTNSLRFHHWPWGWRQ